jgi:hypothetical protein
LFPEDQASAIISHIADNVSTTVQDSDALDPVDLATGEFSYDNTLIHLDGNSLDYTLDIRYRSRATYDGMIGHNWDHNYNKKLVENS